MDLGLEIPQISIGNRVRLMEIKIWMIVFVQMFPFILKMRLVTMIRLRILFRVLLIKQKFRMKL